LSLGYEISPVEIQGQGHLHGSPFTAHLFPDF